VHTIWMFLFSCVMHVAIMCIVLIAIQTVCRYYLVEKAKDANIIGILVGTLGVGMYIATFDLKIPTFARTRLVWTAKLVLRWLCYMIVSYCSSLICANMSYAEHCITQLFSLNMPCAKHPISCSCWV
jgi:hypothetical protein